MRKVSSRIRYIVSAVLFSVCLSFFLWMMESLTTFLWFSDERGATLSYAFFPLSDSAELLSRFIVIFTVLTMGMVVGIVLQQVDNNRRMLNTTLDSIGDGVISIDTNGIVLGMNPVAEHLTGLSFKNVCFQCIYHMFPLIHEDESDPDYVWNMIKSQTAIRHDKRVRLLSSTGEDYAVELSNSPLRYFSGAVAGCVIVMRDISELKEAEKRQKRLQDQLHQSQKMDAIGQIAGGVAHDFNNVLSAIAGATELIQMENGLGRQARDCLDVIHKSTFRAGELTQKLLTFSRKGMNTLGPVDLVDVAYETVYLLKQTLNKNIKIMVVDHSDNSTVSGNKTCLQNALLNIGINAIQAMPGGGTLNYSLDSIYLDEPYCESSSFDIAEGWYVQVSIRDTGCGISPENQKKIFEPFYTTKAIGVGTGLGLATVYGTVLEHKGAITVHSEEGTGTVFHIFLPLTGGMKAP